MTKERRIKLWAAHDKGSYTVWLFNKKPSINEEDCSFWSSSPNEVMGNVDEAVLPDVTYENSPVECEITIKMIEEFKQAMEE